MIKKECLVKIQNPYNKAVLLPNGKRKVLKGYIRHINYETGDFTLVGDKGTAKLYSVDEAMGVCDDIVGITNGQVLGLIVRRDGGEWAK